MGLLLAKDLVSRLSSMKDLVWVTVSLQRWEAYLVLV
jgi:hypothetical protein